MFHGRLLVRDQCELDPVKLPQTLDETVDVGVIQRSLHLIENAERRWLGLQDREHEGNGRQRFLASGKQVYVLQFLARRLGHNIDVRFQRIVFIRQPELRMSPAEQEIILTSNLTERHARAVLRLPGEAEQMQVLEIFVKRQMNVAAAEEYVESILCAAARREEIQSPQTRPDLRQKLVIKDIRLFYNSIDHAVDVIKRSGIPVESTRKETDAGTLIEILLPRKAG